MWKLFCLIVLCASTFGTERQTERQTFYSDGDCNEVLCRVHFKGNGVYDFRNVHHVERIAITPRFPNSVIWIQNFPQLKKIFLQTTELDVPFDCNILKCASSVVHIQRNNEAEIRCCDQMLITTSTTDTSTSTISTSRSTLRTSTLWTSTWTWTTTISTSSTAPMSTSSTAPTSKSSTAPMSTSSTALMSTSLTAPTSTSSTALTSKSSTAPMSTSSTALMSISSTALTSKSSTAPMSTSSTAPTSTSTAVTSASSNDSLKGNEWVVYLSSLSVLLTLIFLFFFALKVITHIKRKLSISHRKSNFAIEMSRFNQGNSSSVPVDGSDGSEEEEIYVISLATSLGICFVALIVVLCFHKYKIIKIRRIRLPMVTLEMDSSPSALSPSLPSPSASPSMSISSIVSLSPSSPSVLPSSSSTVLPSSSRIDTSPASPASPTSVDVLIQPRYMTRSKKRLFMK